MNTLWIDAGKGFIYYSTSEETLEDALREFEDKMWSIGCDLANFGWQEIELRDENENSIEYCGCASLNEFV